MKINVVKMYDDVKLPTYATDGSGCFDIYAYANVHEDLQYSAKVALTAGAAVTFDTGLKFEVPEGYVMLVFSRSGHGFKNSVRLSNCVGVIDSDYRGELMVKLTADFSGSGMNICHGDRIAQAMIVPIPKVEFVEIAEAHLSATHRGSGGFGSTNQCQP